MSTTRDDRLVLPALHEAASRTSRDAQRRFVRGTAAQLVLAVAATVLGAIALLATEASVAAAFAALALIIGALIRGILLATRSELDWYDGRAAAESAKTLAWKYSVAGAPFDLSVTDADGLFLERLHDAMDLFRRGIAAGGTTGTQITDEMRSLRSQPLAARIDTYDQQRLLDQHDWYSKRSNEHRRATIAWNSILLVAQIAGGVCLFLLPTVGEVRLVIPVVGSGGAAVTAWLQTKQFDSTSRAYALAAQELAAIRAKLPGISDEDTWARFVDDAEEAISREHTTWRARRSTS